MSIVDYLDQRLGTHVGVGVELQWHCPACIDRRGSDGSSRKLAINIEKRVGQCWRCGFKFRDLAYLFRYLNGGRLRSEEVDLLRQVSAVPPTSNLKATVYGMMTTETGEDRSLKSQPLPEGVIWLADEDRSSKALRRAWEYLDSRNVLDEDIVRFDIGYVPQGKYANRLLFPIKQGGRVVYWTTRYCGAHLAKALHPPKRDGYFAKRHCLLNYDNVQGQPIVNLVEGPFDAIAFDHAVALMGKTVSDEQIALLASLVEDGLREVVVSLDSEALEDASDIHQRLLCRVPEVSVLALDHGDPYDRRADLAKFMDLRGQPRLTERLRSRFFGKN